MKSSGLHLTEKEPQFFKDDDWVVKTFTNDFAPWFSQENLKKSIQEWIK